MKETGTAHWLSPNTGATNSSGFTALPGGGRWGYGEFGSLTYATFFWSSTEYSSIDGTFQALYGNNDDVISGADFKAYGLSARCVRN